MKYNLNDTQKSKVTMLYICISILALFNILPMWFVLFATIITLILCIDL